MTVEKWIIFEPLICWPTGFHWYTVYGATGL